MTHQERGKSLPTCKTHLCLCHEWRIRVTWLIGSEAESVFWHTATHCNTHSYFEDPLSFRVYGTWRVSPPSSLSLSLPPWFSSTCFERVPRSLSLSLFLPSLSLSHSLTVCVSLSSLSTSICSPLSRARSLSCPITDYLHRNVILGESYQYIGFIHKCILHMHTCDAYIFIHSDK